MTPISIIHPSRGRAKQAFWTAYNWIKSCADASNIEYILSIDATDAAQDEYRDLFSKLPVKILVNDNHSCMQAVNYGALNSTGNILIVNSDDFECPFHWDKAILDSLKDKSDYAVKTYDGCQPWIMTMPMMDRAYYNRFGYIYNPEYSHMFADTEMTHVADLLNRKIELPITFKHAHYTTGLTIKDELNVRNDNTWAQGEALYLKRMGEDFGLIEPPGVLRCDDSHVQWLKQKGISLQII